jgi:hypothetical protein
MKAMHLMLAILAFFATGAEAHECETSCSDRCYVVVAEYERVAAANRAYCGGGGQPDCVRNCTARYNDGTCRTYGPDYCGRRPVCVANCTARYNNDGTCRTYGPDVCGEQPLSCVVRCTARYNNDGTCRSYGADHCGTDAYCRVNCISRYSDGTCREYGPDVCTP